MKTEEQKKEFWKKVQDEVCNCGHSKGYHKPHKFDVHGGECEKEDCNCKIYTWERFVKYSEVD